MVNKKNNLDANEDFVLDVNKFLKTHTFIQGMTGSGKTNLILKIIEVLQNDYPEVQVILLDEQEEFTKITETYPKFKLISKDETEGIFKIEKAYQIGVQARKLGKSLVIKLSDFETSEEQEEFVGEFVKGFVSLRKEVGTPAVLFIDEADLFVPMKAHRQNVPSKYPIINATKRARKQNISIVLSTQFSSEVEIRARRECANRIIGKTTELRDRKLVAEMLGDPKILDSLWELEVGQFYVRGDALTTKISKIQVDLSEIEKVEAGIQQIILKK